MGFSMNIQITGLNTLRKNYEKSPVTIYKGLKKAVGLSGLKVLELAKEEAPEGKTKLLKRTIQVRFNELQARIAPTQPYAIFVHQGTRPHTILPVKKKALFWKGALHPVRRVEHPGTKADPFMERAALRAVPEVEKIFQDNVDATLKAIADNK